ncbi:hypothetical protein FACS1894110_23800 [Spirochaetia bacterium]|nr:hypothetical protein FACS1894110_23800 [Spirochaetia bacterium]
MNQKQFKKLVLTLCQSLKDNPVLFEGENKTALEIDKEWQALCDRYKYKYFQLKNQFQFEKNQFFKKYGRL